ncbi:hypothetical protein NXS19_007652 [Fusarium pseudograminearum]|nr:hypothetical protein NXS19_007652 [Fusarium pseudograminearum]
MQQIVLALDRLKKQANDEIETQPLPGSPPFSRPGTASTTNTNHPLARMPKTTTDSNSTKRRSTISEARTRTNSLSMPQPASQPLRSPTPFGSLGGLARPPVLDDGISGRPFVRVGSPETQSEPGSLPAWYWRPGSRCRSNARSISDNCWSTNYHTNHRYKGYQG